MQNPPFCLEIYEHHRKCCFVPVFICLYDLQEGLHICTSGTLVHLTVKTAPSSTALSASARQKSSHCKSEVGSKSLGCMSWACRSREAAGLLPSVPQVCIFRQAMLPGFSTRSLAMVCKYIYVQIQQKPHPQCIAFAHQVLLIHE